MASDCQNFQLYVCEIELITEIAMLEILCRNFVCAEVSA